MYYLYENENIINEYDKLIEDYNKAYNMPKSKGRCVPSSYIFDEDKSVKWNKEEVLNHNQKIIVENEQCRVLRFEALKEASAHIVDYLHRQAASVSVDTVEELYNYIYDKEYSDNHDIKFVIDTCEEILEIFAK